MKSEIIIKCPHCGCEYLPREIFLPKSFLGNGRDVYRMEDGTLDVYDGENMDLCEEYVCDKCGKPFAVEAVIEFKTTPLISKDFSEAYISAIK